MTTFHATILCLAISLIAVVAEGSPMQSNAPLNRFWKHIAEEHAGLDDEQSGLDRFNDIQKCMQDKLSNVDILKLEEQTKPTIIDTLEDTHTRTILVEVGNAISPIQAQAINHLAECTQASFPETRFQHRDFTQTSGGNDCTFINTLLQLFLPQVYNNVVHITEMAYEEGEWGNQLDLPHPDECGLRTSEYLSYGEFKALGKHVDGGSIYTTIFALSDPESYEGGEYYIIPRDQPSNDKQYFFKPQQYSAMVFLSETQHGVQDISSGHRAMFTNEFWHFPDPPFPGSRRPPEHHMGVFTEMTEHELDVPEDDKYYKAEDLMRLWNNAGAFTNALVDESEL